jgi:hypothetical protein
VIIAGAAQPKKLSLNCCPHKQKKKTNNSKMSSDFLSTELRSEYEQIKLELKSLGDKASLNWKRYVSNEMSEIEKIAYKEKIDKLSNRALVDFEEGETSKMLFDFYRKAYKYDKRNLVLLGDYFDEDHLFILAARNNSMSIIELGLKKLNQKKVEDYEPREIVGSLTILYNCLKKMNVNPREYFQATLRTVDEWLRKDIAQYLTRAEEINSYKAMGYSETNDPKYGLIWTG